jgi:hypothetical protein
MSKETLRKAIAKHVKDYLNRGGVIEQVPRVIFCPANMPWARARGWDYTPWVKLGGPDFFSEQIVVGEGCYMKKPAKTGDD